MKRQTFQPTFDVEGPFSARRIARRFIGFVLTAWAVSLVVGVMVRLLGLA